MKRHARACMLLILTILASAWGSTCLAGARVIFISPNRGYFIAEKGALNGYVKGREVCFDDPKSGRITCGQVYLTTPSASAYALVRQFMTKVSSFSVVSPLRWRDKLPDSTPTQEDIEWLKQKLQSLDLAAKAEAERFGSIESLQNLGASSGTNDWSHANRDSQSPPPPSAGWTPQQPIASPQPEQAQQTAAPNASPPAAAPKTPPTGVSESSPETSQPLARILTQVLGRPTEVQLGYHWLLAPPSKNERLEFVTQSAGSHDVWRSTKTTALPRAALSPNLRQYLSAKSPWYYGAMATWWPSIQRTNRSRFDDRRSDLSVTVAEDISSAQYTLFFGGRSAMRFDTSISYLTGLTLFREDYQATARSSGAATTDILADVSHSRSYLMIPLTAEFGLSFGRFTAGIDVTIQIVAKDLSDSPKVVVSDPNFDNGDQSESAEAQLRDILGDSDQLMSASAGAYVSWRF